MDALEDPLGPVVREVVRVLVETEIRLGRPLTDGEVFMAKWHIDRERGFADV